MTITTRRRVGSDGATISQIYRKFKKESNTNISLKEFREIIEQTHLFIYNKICSREFKVYVSKSIGSFYIDCSNSRNRVINSKLSKEYGKAIFFRNEHTNGHRFKIANTKSEIHASFNACFRFRAARNLNRDLAKRIFNKEIPIWT